MIEKNYSLKQFNSFAIEASAAQLFRFHSLSQLPDLLSVIQKNRSEHKPILLLGGGSNTLFCDDFDGLVIKVELLGVERSEDDEFYRLKVAAGEDWPKLVESTLQQGILGLENLALIPGLVGSAPVQNIGAYGVELTDVCESVDYIDLIDGELKTLDNAGCLFSYRDSIFKHALQGRALITSVSLKLVKQWQPICRYGLLQAIDETTETITAQQIFEHVCQIRSEKLPDPTTLGNAGSFFKNPVVSEHLSGQLLSHYPDMPHYPQADGTVKLAAGWLIDQCGLKGYQVGDAAVHKQQALVLVNIGHATAQDVIDLAWEVREQVLRKFAVVLEHEVRFVDAQGETTLQQVKADV